MWRGASVSFVVGVTMPPLGSRYVAPRFRRAACRVAGGCVIVVRGALSGADGPVCWAVSVDACAGAVSETAIP